MRSVRHGYDIARPSLRHVPMHILGLPFALLALISGIVFGWAACLVALMFASLANFVVFIPLTVLALNGGAALPADAPAPPLTLRAYAMLLTLWTATLWLAALMVR